MKKPLPLIWCIILPLIPAVLGVAFAIDLGLQFIHGLKSDVAKSIFPGAAEFTIDEPGRYNVWLHTSTILEGTVYESAESPPGGTQINLFDKDSQTKLELQSGMTTRRTVGSDESVALGYFEVEQPATVALKVTGDDTIPFVLSVGPANFMKIFFSLAGAIASLFAGLALAVILAVILAIKRSLSTPPSPFARRPHTPPQNPPPPTR